MNGDFREGNFNDGGLGDGEYRIEHDTMGDVRVPATALWRAQTQRAVENFPISGYRAGTRSHRRPRRDQGGRR